MQPEHNENDWYNEFVIAGIVEDVIESDFTSGNIAGTSVIVPDYHHPALQKRLREVVLENEFASVDIPGTSSVFDHDYHLRVLESRNLSYKEPSTVNTQYIFSCM